MYVIERTVDLVPDGVPELFTTPHAAAVAWCNRINADRNPARVYEKVCAGVVMHERERGSRAVLTLRHEEPLAYAARRLRFIQERFDTLAGAGDDAELFAVANAALDVFTAAVEAIARRHETKGGTDG